MISRAVIYVDDDPKVVVDSETGLTCPELDDPETPGADVEMIRMNLETAFNELFPENSVEVRFPEFGECS